MDLLYLGWHLGQVPSGSTLDTMTGDQADAMMTLIREWQRLSRAEDYRTLALMLCGKQESGDGGKP